MWRLLDGLLSLFCRPLAPPPPPPLAAPAQESESRLKGRARDSVTEGTQSSVGALAGRSGADSPPSFPPTAAGLPAFCFVPKCLAPPKVPGPWQRGGAVGAPSFAVSVPSSSEWPHSLGSFPSPLCWGWGVHLPPPAPSYEIHSEQCSQTTAATSWDPPPLTGPTGPPSPSTRH